MTEAEEAVVQALYAGKACSLYADKTAAYCKWNGRHPAEENMTVYTVQPGTTLKIVMVSRFGDCGLTDDLTATRGYHCRASWDSGDIKDIRWEP